MSCLKEELYRVLVLSTTGGFLKRILLRLPLTYSLCLTLSFFVLFAQPAYADDSYLSMTISSDVASLEITPGIFSSTSQTISVSTNYSAGYYITIQTSGSSTDLVNAEDNNLTFPTFTLPSGSTSLPANNTGYGYGYSVDGGLDYFPMPDPSGGGGHYSMLASPEALNTN